MRELQILSCGRFDSRTRFHDRAKSDPRTVCDYELELFLGDKGVSVINQEKVPIRRGHLLLAKPGDRRYSFLPFEAEYIHFTVNDAAVKALLEPLPSVIAPPDTLTVKTAFEEILRLSRSGKELDQLAAASHLFLLIHLFTENGSADSRSTDAVAKVKRMIEETYADDLTVADLAAACHISETHLYRLFSSTLGVSPNDYLNRVRFAAACRLLTDTDLPVGEIAASCGFHSGSYFSDFFRKHTGKTPRDYRNSKRYLL